jgi:hypothetical protein
MGLRRKRPGVVDDDVEPAEPIVREGDGGLGGAGLRRVAGERRDAIGRELLDGRVDVLGDDARTRGPQLLDDGGPDATRGAGDDRHGTVEARVIAARRHLGREVIA